MHSNIHGYYRHPTLSGGQVVFSCENDLWEVDDGGGTARRLTDRGGAFPCFAPDGKQLAFASRMELSSDIYVMAAGGGAAERLTFQDTTARVVGWTPDAQRVIYSSSYGFPVSRCQRLWSVPASGGPATVLPFGPADRISYGPNGARVLGRSMAEPAFWKRCRGGLTGELWIDREGSGQFRPLLTLAGQVIDPMWLGDRIYFLCDESGVCNLHSCDLSGKDLRQHTEHNEFYARNASSDGQRIVYHAGADLYVFEPDSQSTRRLDVRIASASSAQGAGYLRAGLNLEGFDLHPQGHSLAVVARGRPFTFGNWEQAVVQHGERDGVRYRLATHLQDQRHLVCVSDKGGEEALELRLLKPPVGAPEEVTRFDELDVGRAHALVASPSCNGVAIVNHRYELLWVDLTTGKLSQLDHSHFAPIPAPCFSPDGATLVYSFAGRHGSMHLRAVTLADGTVHDLTVPVGVDYGASFDPTGKYLFFCSIRDFDSIWDGLVFDRHFVGEGKVYLLTLRKDVPSPLTPPPKTLDGKVALDPRTPPDRAEGRTGHKEPASAADACQGSQNNAGESSAEASSAAKGEEKGKEKADTQADGAASSRTEIDYEGIAGRIIMLPVRSATYGQVLAISDSKVLYSRRSRRSDSDDSGSTLICYDFDKQEEEVYTGDIRDFSLSADRKTLALLTTRERIRVVKAESRPSNDGSHPGRASGYVDLDRIRLSYQQAAEWRQMLREAWRLQRDQFWRADMSGVDWPAMYERYAPLLERVSTESEWTDVLLELLGELGTSHADGGWGSRVQHTGTFWHFAGVGKLGAELTLEGDRWTLRELLRGDSWDASCDSPLARPGLDIQPGDKILMINGQPLHADRSPEASLVHLADVPVTVVVQRGDGPPREVEVKPLQDERRLRYRHFVERNRRLVHAWSEGALGYIHVPDMGEEGYSEFHRYYGEELGRIGLVIDVRYNGGGNVSQLLLEKLGRKRIGYKVSRHRAVKPYPAESVLGPMVCVTNEYAGSDGDIFSHNFKLMGLGKLIGKRTWGGTIGVLPTHRLVDGTQTRQPEYANWFVDVGFALENGGAMPDEVVEITPQDWAADRDTQLERAVAIAMEEIAIHKPHLPEFGLDERKANQ